MRILSRILDLLYPEYCRTCGAGLSGGGEKFFCADCLDGAKRLGGQCCTVCGEPFRGVGAGHLCASCHADAPPFGMARAPMVYGGAVQDAVQLFKYRRFRSLGAYLGSLAGDGARRWFSDYEVVAPVPLHGRRLRDRGFNQSLVLAQGAAAATGATLSHAGLLRTRHTRPQVALGPDERIRNVRGAFAVAGPDDFRGRSVLLVDDVYTTGATVRECARVLKDAGADTVGVLTVARVVM